MKKMSEKLGTWTVTIAAKSPFSNGICERHYLSFFCETMTKTMENTKCEPGLTLPWAVSAEKALLNKSGFSPVLTDLPVELESTKSSDIVRQNLDVTHKTRVNKKSHWL